MTMANINTSRDSRLKYKWSLAWQTKPHQNQQNEQAFIQNQPSHANKTENREAQPNSHVLPKNPYIAAPSIQHHLIGNIVVSPACTLCCCCCCCWPPLL
jgi:hypothetical protein